MAFPLDMLNCTLIKSFNLIRDYSTIAYLELLSLEFLAVAENPSLPHLSQTPKTQETYVRESSTRVQHDIAFQGEYHYTN